MRRYILAACLTLATIAAAQAAGPNCETLVSHRDGLTTDEIAVIEQNAHHLGMSPDELLYWQTQARAKGMDPNAWDTIKLSSKMMHAASQGSSLPPVCVPH